MADDERTADPGLAVKVDAPIKPDSGAAADALPEPTERKAEPEGGDANAVAKEKEGDRAGDQDWFTPDLRQAMTARDMTEDEARMFGSPDALNAAFTLMDRKIADLGRAPEDESAGEEAPEKSADQEPSERPPAKKPAAKDAAEDSFGIEELDPEEFHPAVVGTFKKLADKISGMERSLAVAIGESTALRKHFLDQETQAFEDRLEGYFAGMGQEYEPALGKGRGTEIVGTPQYDKRAKIVGEMHALQAGYMRLGRAVPKEKELFDRASCMVLGKEMAAAARRKLTEKVQQRGSEMVSRPTHRNTAPTGAETMKEENKRIEAVVTAKARELGLMVD